MNAEVFKRLFEIENVTSIKWTSSDFYQMMIFKEITNGEMAIINGFDEMLLIGLCAGAGGGIGTTYNYQLKYVREVYESFLMGNVWKCVGYDVGNATFPMKRYSVEEKQKIYAKVKSIFNVLEKLINNSILHIKINIDTLNCFIKKNLV